ncbi:MAG TPA: TetR/AcrR family transcriptional regulator [Streptosporangiaceae bacterium]|jgi:AcrR family transcriptional regulator
MSTESADRRRATGERNVQAILDAVEDLLERNAQPTISAVSAQAGVSRVTVYAHFPTTVALLEAILQRSVERTAAVLERAQPNVGPPPEALERLLSAGWRDLHRYGAVIDAALARLSPGVVDPSHLAGHELIRDIIRRGQLDGSFRSDLPLEWLVTGCFALIHASAEQVRIGAMDPAVAHTALVTAIMDLVAARPAR